MEVLQLDVLGERALLKLTKTSGLDVKKMGSSRNDRTFLVNLIAYKASPRFLKNVQSYLSFHHCGLLNFSFVFI